MAAAGAREKPLSVGGGCTSKLKPQTLRGATMGAIEVEVIAKSAVGPRLVVFALARVMPWRHAAVPEAASGHQGDQRAGAPRRADGEEEGGEGSCHQPDGDGEALHGRVPKE